MQTSLPNDDLPTLVVVGIAAASLAAVAHETLGHGIGCLVVGGHITLLTSIYFRCLGATPLTDAAGPIGNALAAVLSLGLLRWHRSWTAPSRLFLTFFAAFNLFWFAGQLIYSAVLNIDDLAFVARYMAWPSSWRSMAALLGLLLYVIGVRFMISLIRDLIVPHEPRDQIRRRVLLTYAAATLSALLAGLLWRRNPWGSAINAVLAVGVAPLGLMIAMRRAERLGSLRSDTTPVMRSWTWIVIGSLVFLLFAAIQGPGLGSLA